MDLSRQMSEEEVRELIDEEISKIYQEVQFRKINSEMTINEALNIINEQDGSDLTFHERLKG